MSWNQGGPPPPGGYPPQHPHPHGHFQQPPQQGQGPPPPGQGPPVQHGAQPGPPLSNQGGPPQHFPQGPGGGNFNPPSQGYAPNQNYGTGPGYPPQQQHQQPPQGHAQAPPPGGQGYYPPQNAGGTPLAQHQGPLPHGPGGPMQPPGQYFPQGSMPGGPPPGPQLPNLPEVWVNPLTGLPMNGYRSLKEVNAPPPAPEPVPNNQLMPVTTTKKPAPPEPEKKGCGCKKGLKDPAHECLKACTSFMGCTGSCNYPAEQPKTKKKAQSAAAVAAKQKEAQEQKVKEEKEKEANLRRREQQQQQQSPPQEMPPQQQQGGMGPMDLGGSALGQHPRPYPQDQMGPPPGQGGPPMQQGGYGYGMAQHPHQPVGLSPNMGPHGGGVSPNVGPNRVSPHGQMMNNSPGLMPQQSVNPKPATEAGMPFVGGPPGAKRESRALKIVAPEGDPRGPNGKGFTFDQMAQVQKEVTQVREELKRGVKPLCDFVHDYSTLWRDVGGGVNVIIAQKSKQTEKEKVLRKIKGVLNKLTPEKMISLKAQMLEMMEQAMAHEENEAAVLQDIVKLVYEEAVSVKEFTTTYADLCLDISTHNVTRLGLNTTMQEPFRKALINICQREYTDANDALDREEDAELDEIAKSRAKTRALNNIHFVGELYKRHLLNEKIIHTVLNSLLQEDKNLDEERLEKVVKLLTTSGQSLEASKDTKLRAEMDRYFVVLSAIRNTKGTRRLGFLVQDLMDLRDNRWVQKQRGGKGPQKLEDMKRQMLQDELSRAMKAGPSQRIDLGIPMLLEDFAKQQSPSGQVRSTVCFFSIPSFFSLCVRFSQAQQRKRHKQLLRLPFQERAGYLHGTILEGLCNPTTPDASMEGLGKWLNHVVCLSPPPLFANTGDALALTFTTSKKKRHNASQQPLPFPPTQADTDISLPSIFSGVAKAVVAAPRGPECWVRFEDLLKAVQPIRLLETEVASTSFGKQTPTPPRPKTHPNHATPHTRTFRRVLRAGPSPRDGLRRQPTQGFLRRRPAVPLRRVARHAQGCRLDVRGRAGGRRPPGCRPVPRQRAVFGCLPHTARRRVLCHRGMQNVNPSSSSSSAPDTHHRFFCRRLTRLRFWPVSLPPSGSRGCTPTTASRRGPTRQTPRKQ